MSKTLVREQIIPISLTVVVCAVLVLLLWGEIQLLNYFNPEDIVVHLRWIDILIGGTIYLKTSIDFAVFIARLMDKNRGWKSRIAIEIGTALGNALGTLAVLVLWDVFRQFSWLLGLMIFIASLVLLKMAEEGLEHVDGNRQLAKFSHILSKLLGKLNKVFNPLLKYIVPEMHADTKANLRFWPLIGFAFVIPFILGLDDFAGYVPLFDIVNVFGFATGVFVGHMLLNILLYLSPRHTIEVIRNAYISFAGSIVFIGLAVWGLIEVVKIVTHAH